MGLQLRISIIASDLCVRPLQVILKYFFLDYASYTDGVTIESYLMTIFFMCSFEKVM